MPHDMHGRKIEQGDTVAYKSWIKGGKLDSGHVLGVNEGSEFCNLTVEAPGPGFVTVNAKETEILLTVNGLKPTPGSRFGNEGTLG